MACGTDPPPPQRVLSCDEFSLVAAGAFERPLTPMSSLPPLVTGKTFHASLLDAYRERAEGGGSPVVPGTHLQRLPKPTMAELKEKKRRRARAQCHAERWWEKRPTIAGEACNERQGRLCEVESFTGLYKRRFDPSKAAMRAVSGDYCADPLGAERMLQSKTCAELTIPGRAADFRTEVEWRMRLRSRGVGGGLPPLPGGASANPPRLLRLDRIK